MDEKLLMTGDAARLLGTSEARLSEIVRRGKIDPPPVLAGRRIWSLRHVVQAAAVLGIPDVELYARLGREVRDAP